MILLFKSTLLHQDYHFAEEFFNFDKRRINSKQSHRSGTKEKREKKGTGEEQDGWD